MTHKECAHILGAVFPGQVFLPSQEQHTGWAVSGDKAVWIRRSFLSPEGEQELKDRSIQVKAAPYL